MTDSSSNRRVGPRVPVAWWAECHLDGKVTKGVVRDVSGGGVFFAPVIYEQTRAGERARVASLLEPGDTVLLTYQPDWQEKPLVLTATVRWVGFSRENDVDGAGMSFQEE